MKYNATIQLKNNKECLLRNAQLEDAKDLLDCFNTTHSQTDFLLTYPEENSITVDDEKKFIIEKIESNNEIEICAFVDGKLAGSAGIEEIGKKNKIKHRAEFGISIIKDYWGLGIGKALTKACIECAKIACFTQLELNVVSDNTSAYSLYKSCGFIEFGRNPRAFNSKLNGYQEIVLMRLELD